MEDIEGFIHPSPRHVIDPFVFNNMDKAVEIMKQIKDGTIKTIFMKVDPDIDGFSSAAAMTVLIHHLNPETQIQHQFAVGKEHGFPKDVIGRYDLIIMPDAGSDPVSFALLRERTEPALIIDHHPFDASEVPENCIVVNCQQEGSPNRTLTGAGMVGKLHEALFREGLLGEKDWYDDPSVNRMVYGLVAVGLIGDVADLKNLDSRYYAMKGIQAINKEVELLKEARAKEGAERGTFSLPAEIMQRNSYEIIHGATLKAIAWNVSPLFNAVTRIGTPEEKRDLFDALCGAERLVKYHPRRKKKTDPLPKPYYVTLQEDMARQCSNIKSRQDKRANASKDKCEAQIGAPSTYVDTIVVAKRDISGDGGTLTGLIANKLTKTYHRPVLVLAERGDSLRGSGRGYQRCGIPDFKALLESTGVCKMLAGHPNAFGVEVESSRLNELIEEVNARVPLDTLEIQEQVDYEVDANFLDKDIIRDVGDHYDLWGNGVEEPTFAITNIKIFSDDIKSHSNGRILSFVYQGIRYVRKHCASGTLERLLDSVKGTGIGNVNRPLNLLVLGSFQVETYEDNTNAFVEILEWSAVEE